MFLAVVNSGYVFNLLYDHPFLLFMLMYLVGAYYISMKNKIHEFYL